MIQILIVLASTFVFLYILHYYVRDDFVILRKNVSIEDIFNAAFLSFFFVFLTSRIFYILENPSPIFINPLVFLAVPYYPGFSLSAGLLGGAVFLAWYVRKKKYPAKRIFDFFSISVLWSITAYFLLSFLTFRLFDVQHVAELLMSFVMTIVFTIFLMPRYLSGKIKDGFITGAFAVGYSATQAVTLLLEGIKLASIIEAVLLGVIFLSGIFFIIKEELTPRIKDLK